MNDNVDKFDEYVECGEGWKSLYQPLIDFVREYNKEHLPDSYIVINQIKEKFAGLRFYYDAYGVPRDITDKFDEMISEAEYKSFDICERCGNTENVGLAKGSGWYFTICEDCLKKIAKTNNRTYSWMHDNVVYEINKDGKKKKV